MQQHQLGTAAALDDAQPDTARRDITRRCAQVVGRRLGRALGHWRGRAYFNMSEP
jgi:hypothetical protein